MCLVQTHTFKIRRQRWKKAVVVEVYSHKMKILFLYLEQSLYCDITLTFFLRHFILKKENERQG